LNNRKVIEESERHYLECPKPTAAYGIGCVSKNSVSALGKHLPNGVLGEETKVCAVKDSAVFVLKPVAEDQFQYGNICDVRNTGDYDSARSEVIAQFNEHLPWVNQVLQHIGAHDAVEIGPRQAFMLDRSVNYAVETMLGFMCWFGRQLNAINLFNTGKLGGRAEHAGSAANVQKALSAMRHERNNFWPTVGVVGIH
jgi:hypothetical protein